MQAGGVLGRIALGWLSDRLQSATASLSVAAIVSQTTTALLGLSSSHWPLWTVVALAFVAGLSAATWNGALIAEIARRSLHRPLSTTWAGTSIPVNMHNTLHPTPFPTLVPFP